MVGTNEIPVERLRELLAYDPATGEFTWRVPRPGGVRAGDRVGYTNKSTGYRRVTADGVCLSEQRMAWAYMTGEWPTFEIDHEDTDCANNRWRNLRPATHSQNTANATLRADSTSGFKGVHFHKHNGRWVAYVNVNKKRLHLGCFGTAEEAHAAYVAAARKYHGEFARAA